MGRSRSPARSRSDTEWISRAIVIFGRYPDKRPAGLHVEGSGAFLLDDLVRIWGRHQGLSAEDIMRAIRRHMFHEEENALRFAVDTDLQENIIIRVMPKRKKQQHYEGYAPPAFGRRRPRVQTARGSIAKSHWPVREPICVDDDDAPQALTKEDKLSMSLDDLVHQDSGRRKDHKHSEAAGRVVGKEEEDELQQRRSRIFGQCEKMGLTKDTMHRRLAPRKPARDGRYWDDEGKRQAYWNRNGRYGKEDRGWERRWDDQRQDVGRNGHSAWEKVSRWIVWVLSVGHEKLGVTIDDGWVTLAELAAAMAKERKNFGEFTDDSLGVFITANDNGRRLQVLDGRVRRLARDRQPQQADSTGPPATASSSQGRRRSISSESSRSDRRRIEIDSDDEQLAATAAKSLRVGCNAVDAELAADAAKVERVLNGGSAEEKKPPPKPPGIGWTKYQDDDTVWWYYEGDFGKWWCSTEDGEPQPYIDEE